MLRRRMYRTTVVAVASAAAMALGVGIASAHITAHPGEAQQTTLSKIAYRVPNESPTAGTVKVEIDFPSDHPIAIAAAKPHPGWTHSVTKKKLDHPVTNTGNGDIPSFDTAVTSITWTAQPGVQIAPGEFDEFEVVVGPLPTNTDLFTTPGIQTYSDGSVVKWDQPWPKGQPEPDHPAPKVELTGGDPSLQVSQVAYHSPNLDSAERDAVATEIRQLPGYPQNTSAGTAPWLITAALALGALGGAGIGARTVVSLRGRRHNNAA